MKDLQFLKEVKEYIESCERAFDGEWGSCREVEELIKDNAMPKLYQEVLKRIREN